MEDQVFRRMTEEEIDLWYKTDFSEAFAENERKPVADILELIRQERYELWGLFKGPRLIGYAALWKREGIPLVLLDYLGVTAALRSRGIGAQILDVLISQGHPIVAESELPVPEDSEEANKIRARRIDFYRRNGFAPAYEMATCGMRWQAMLANADGLDPADIMRWHKELYGPERTDVKVPLGPDETPELPYWMK